MTEFRPTMAQLRGLPYEYAECFGKPHVGASYAHQAMGANMLDQGARCAWCGRPATNSHHVPPRSKGSFLFVGTNGYTTTLLPALVALCGMGNVSGCHAMAHRHSLAVRWVWETEQAAHMWWSGELFATGIAPHSPALYELGHWELSHEAVGRVKVVGR